MDVAPLLPGRPYWMKLGSKTVTATVHPPKYQVSVNTMEHFAARTLELNAIGVANVATDSMIAFEPYETQAPKACSTLAHGLPGAGKSTLGNMVSKKLAALGRHTFLLDGDNIRHGLNRDLGFTQADRDTSKMTLEEATDALITTSHTRGTNKQ